MRRTLASLLALVACSDSGGGGTAGACEPGGTLPDVSFTVSAPGWSPDPGGAAVWVEADCSVEAATADGLSLTCSDAGTERTVTLGASDGVGGDGLAPGQAVRLTYFEGSADLPPVRRWAALRSASAGTLLWAALRSDVLTPPIDGMLAPLGLTRVAGVCAPEASGPCLRIERLAVDVDAGRGPVEVRDGETAVSVDNFRVDLRASHTDLAHPEDPGCVGDGSNLDVFDLLARYRFPPD